MPSTPSNAPSLEEAVRKMAPLTRQLFTNLRERAQHFGPDVQVGITATYVKLSAGNTFAELHPRKYGLLIYIRPEGSVSSRPRRS